MSRPVLPHARRAVAGVLVAIPLLFAVVGPWIASYAPAASQAPFGPSTWAPFGTDRLGRDVLAAALLGGRPLVVTAILTVAAAYALGFVLGITAAASHQQWLEDLLMRPIDVLLCLPSLLIVMVAALRTDGSGLAIAVAVGFTLVAPIARFVRMAARGVVQGPAMEALRMQGVGAVERYGRFSVRELARPIAADLGVRLVAAVYVLASANFLGIGFDTTSTDWAVSVAANNDGLSVAPWSVYLPAALVVSLVLGLNLWWDDLLSDPTSRDVRRAREVESPVDLT